MIALEQIPETEKLYVYAEGNSVILSDGRKVIARQRCADAVQAGRESAEIADLMRMEGKSIRARGGRFPRISRRRLHDDDLDSVAARG